MTSLFTNPFDALLDLQRALDQSLFSDWLGLSTSARGAFPPVNIFQQDHDLVLIAELPGVEKGDLEITVKGDQLRITGTKKVEYEGKVSLHRRERVAGDFDRTFTLPVQIDADAVKAEYRDGLLALYLPRAEQDKPKAIEIH